MTSRRPKRPLKPEELALWQEVTKSDKPLDEKKKPIAPPDGPRISRRRVADRVYQAMQPESLPASPKGAGMDAKLATRLKRGKLAIDGRIDLHGLTVREAEDRLNRYIAQAVVEGRRMILVITGKGAPPPEPHERDYMPERPRPGAIRTALPQWLREGPHAGRILGIEPAQPKDGGAGACYVLLRRERDR